MSKDYLHNIMNSRDKLTSFVRAFRRLLLLGLVVLSVWLYCKNNKYSQSPELSAEESTGLVANWGTEAEQLAREKDMPIFFSIGDTFRKESQSEDIIKKHFIYTELDPELYPADHLALKALHCNIGENVNITCGVLTSKMYPILTSTNPTFKHEDKNAEPSIDDTLKGLVNIYHKNYNRFLKLSKSFYLLEDVPSEFPFELLDEDMDKLAFMLDFGYNEKFKPAQISESARLIFRNCTIAEFSILRTKLKNIAYEEIVKKAKEGDKSDFIHRSFYIRALSEYILSFDDFENVDLVKEFANEIKSCQDKDGSFVIEGSKNTLYNAFSLTILSYAYKITKDESYKQSIEKFVVFLDSELKKRHALAANFKEGGISGAKGYVYLARALLNSYIVSYNESSLKLVNQILLRLKKNHRTLNSMVLELPESSTLAKYINLCSIEDDSYTSTNGVLVQLYCDMHNLNITNELDLKIKDIFNSTLDSPTQSTGFDFSLRLAKRFNPLISLSTVKKINIAKENLK